MRSFLGFLKRSKADEGPGKVSTARSDTLVDVLEAKNMSSPNSTPSSPSQGPRQYKRGEFIFKEGDKAESIFLIQSGKVALCIIRPTTKIEIQTLSKGAVLADQALHGMVKHVLSAECQSDVQVLEVPLNVAKSQLDALSGFFKTLMKSMADTNKLFTTELKSIKLEKEAVPCPQIYIPRVFSCINLVTRHLGKKQEDGDWEIAWNSLKVFGIRMFLEAPNRLQSALELLTKIKLAEMHYEKNDEGDTELSKIKIKNLQLVEDFGEFFQYNLYKGGVSEIIKFDDIAYQVAKTMVKATEGREVDRQGTVSLTFNELSAVVQEDMGLPLKNTHIDLLEKKGLFMKRRPTDTEVFLHFDRKEYSQTVSFWQILSEIDKWNSTGRVNMNEEVKKKAKPGEETCPECANAIPKEAKFCMNCGFKLKAAS